jgi:hypothetical protein
VGGVGWFGIGHPICMREKLVIFTPQFIVDVVGATNDHVVDDAVLSILF